MIKFFRKIRQRLMSESQFSKYLLYAIGEIVLVVIGILIALNINNWNEERIVKDKEHQALVELLSDLELNISSLNDALYTSESSIKNCQNSIKIIVSNLEETCIYQDSLSRHFSNIFRYPDMDIKTSGYESLSSMGMDLISDDHLRSEIGKFYTYTIPSVKQSYNEIRDDFYNYMLTYRREEFRTESVNYINKLTPVRYETLCANFTFIESAKAYGGVFDYYKGRAIKALEEAEKLHRELESKLKGT